MTDAIDPQGQIAEAYRIDGIDLADCRTIFLDWALVLPADTDPQHAITALLERHGTEDHPMTQVLREGLAAPDRKGRRGGWRARRGAPET
ncbi:hypothetical protein [Litorisediminicola beolgyonensis]|uniref:Uncharacterized protein n=1 Tax=Litorisediminicola beolgyonensis TaxID=1173614 RepID=A0ABW3ZH25_9RHOB